MYISTCVSLLIRLTECLLTTTTLGCEEGNTLTCNDFFVESMKLRREQQIKNYSELTRDE